MVSGVVAPRRGDRTSTGPVRSWEHLRLDAATGTSVWFRDHADHHMAVLLSADGPFKGCKPTGHAERLEPLPLTAPPVGLFDAP